MFIPWRFLFYRQTRLWFVLPLLLVVTNAFAEPGAVAGGNGQLSRVHWNAAKQGKFVTALCRDHQGNLWAGTEDHGVWEYHTKTQKWHQFTVATTGGNPASSKLGPVLTAGTPNEHALGDNHIYAIACDKLGRIWVGHLNHGVSVYSNNTSGGGKLWENYDVINGPLGERVFDIATSPVDGDVWIATDEGLTRYSLSHDKWLYYTRAPGNQGLPSNQIEAIAFAKDGTLYAASQCHGLAICQPIPNYAPKNPLVSRQWRTVTSKYIGSPPLIPMGRGLPSNLLNDVMVAHDGTVWVATDEGLAWSKDKGQSWKFVRGHHWQEKDDGLYPAKVTSAQVQAIAKKYAAGHDLLLSEDHCTSLAEAGDGDIWIGHWRSGIEMIDPRTGKHYQSRYDPLFQGGKKKKIKNAPFVRQGPTDDVFSLLALPDQPPVIGFYGGGMVQMPDKFTPKKQAAAHPGAKAFHHPPQVAKVDAAKLPSPAMPLTTSQLKRLIAKIKIDGRRPTPGNSIPWAMYLGDDWMTQGDYVGRYGRENAMLCANDSPSDYDLSPPIIPVRIEGKMGAHHTKDDGLRHWVQAVRTDNHNSLYNPMIGIRRQSSWDDHGETYSNTYQGPDVWVTVSVPEGLHYVSLYFYNKDGHTRLNRFRDYTIDVYPINKNGHTEKKILARARVVNFRGGVYKRFVFKGPAKYAIKIGRNYSFNTIVSGVFVNRLSGKPYLSEGYPMMFMGDVHYSENRSFMQDKLPPMMPADDARALFATPNSRFAMHFRTDASVLQAREAQLMALRMCWGQQNGKKLAEAARWQLDAWTVQDRVDFVSTMRRAWHSEQEYTASLRTKKYRKYSPHVYDTPEQWAKHELSYYPGPNRKEPLP